MSTAVHQLVRNRTFHKLHSEGMSYADIARQEGLSPSRIRQIVMGVQRREDRFKNFFEPDTLASITTILDHPHGYKFLKNYEEILDMRLWKI